MALFPAIEDDAIFLSRSDESEVLSLINQKKSSKELIDSEHSSDGECFMMLRKFTSTRFN